MLSSSSSEGGEKKLLISLEGEVSQGVTGSLIATTLRCLTGMTCGVIRKPQDVLLQFRTPWLETAYNRPSQVDLNTFDMRRLYNASVVRAKLVFCALFVRLVVLAPCTGL